GVEIWHELNGRSVYPVDPRHKDSYQSISKFKTFSPPTTDKQQVKAFLLRNLESACIKARRYSLAAQEVHITLRTQDFRHFSLGAHLNRASANPMELAKVVDPLLDKIFQPNQFRATGVVLTKLISDDCIQLALFSDPVRIEKFEQAARIIDLINAKYGKHTLHIASSLAADKQHTGQRGRLPERKTTLLKGETARQRLKYPMALIEV
ncbi:MAG TPA: DNA polymerase IV, partial [bacterium]|nr:DNA polymerase IV [bacterium]